MAWLYSDCKLAEVCGRLPVPGPCDWDGVDSSGLVDRGRALVPGSETLVPSRLEQLAPSADRPSRQTFQLCVCGPDSILAPVPRSGTSSRVLRLWEP